MDKWRFFNHYVNIIVTFTIGPRPGNVRSRPGPQPAKLLLTSPGPARACKFQARTRPGPQTIIETWPGPAHGLRAGPARGPRPGPCRTLRATVLSVTYFVIGCLSTIISPTVFTHCTFFLWPPSHTFVTTKSHPSPPQANTITSLCHMVLLHTIGSSFIRQRRVSCCGPLCSGTHWSDQQSLPYTWNRGWREGNFTRESASTGNR